jgi:hypothetical protein
VTFAGRAAALQGAASSTRLALNLNSRRSDGERRTKTDRIPEKNFADSFRRFQGSSATLFVSHAMVPVNPVLEKSSMNAAICSLVRDSAIHLVSVGRDSARGGEIRR